MFASRHPSSIEPTAADISALRTLSSHIARRSASIIAASIVALWELKIEAEEDLLGILPADSPFAAETRVEMEIERPAVAFNGSVVENYPGYQDMVKEYIEKLLIADGRRDGVSSIELIPAKESSLLGAAVALACLE